MRLYIDPGTGSMLFAILLGVIGAANYLIRGWAAKMRFLMSGGKSKDVADAKIPFVIFSDDKRYWMVFEPICREFDKRGIDVTYMTASPDDPALQCKYSHVKAKFIGTGNKPYSKLNFLDAVILISTTPGLDVYQWKRSKNVSFYVHIVHAASDVTIYRMFGIDYYDAILLSGDYQIEQVRKLEKLRGLPEKELILAGLPYMDEMASKLAADADKPSSAKKTVLIAPSWGKSAIFAKFGGRVIEELLKTDYNIIIRPHPQSVISEKKLLDKLSTEYPDSDRISWNYDANNYEVLKKADIMISDFSGVIFEFALIYDKPVIYTNTEFDNSPYDAWWLDEELWTFKALPLLGAELSEDTMKQLPSIIEDCLSNTKYSENRQTLRDETWVNFGHGAESAVDYLVGKYAELTKKEEA